MACDCIGLFLFQVANGYFMLFLWFAKFFKGMLKATHPPLGSACNFAPMTLNDTGEGETCYGILIFWTSIGGLNMFYILIHFRHEKTLVYFITLE